ncbi:MAG: hypothetical protein WKF54_08230 [Nocardioidaceae bacterium]
MLANADMEDPAVTDGGYSNDRVRVNFIRPIQAAQVGETFPGNGIRVIRASSLRNPPAMAAVGDDRDSAPHSFAIRDQRIVS